MTEPDPLFSVIVTTFERPRLLREAVESVLAQTEGDFELLVVDDGSSEPAVVPTHPKVRLIRRPQNGGPAAARNTGLRNAKGTFVCFLDDDDLFAARRLEVAAGHLHLAPLVVAWSRFIDEPAKPGRVLKGDVRDVILDETTPHLGAVTVRRRVVLPFDERFPAVEDVEWWLRQSRVCEVTTIPEFVYLVRKHDGRRDHHGAAARIECSVTLLKKNGEYFERHPVARAFRWKRIGLMALQEGDRRFARTAFLRSLSARVEPRTAWHFVRALVPARRKDEGVGVAA